MNPFNLFKKDPPKVELVMKDYPMKTRAGQHPVYHQTNFTKEFENYYGKLPDYQKFTVEIYIYLKSSDNPVSWKRSGNDLLAYVQYLRRSRDLYDFEEIEGISDDEDTDRETVSSLYCEWSPIFFFEEQLMEWFFYARNDRYFNIAYGDHFEEIANALILDREDLTGRFEMKITKDF